MVLVFDTKEHPERERADALCAALQVAGLPAHVRPEDEQGVDARLQLWDLGGGSHLMHRYGTGVNLARTDRHVRVAAPDRLGLTLLSPGRWTHEQYRTHHAGDRQQGTLMLVNQAAPYHYDRRDRGVTLAINVDRTELDVPAEVAARAAQNLSAATTLHNLLRTHLQSLLPVATSAPEMLRTLYPSTLHLVRALITAAAHDEERHRESMASSLTNRIQMYIAAHLTEPDLSPDRIAAAHQISVRHLYAIWPRTGRSLSEAIIEQRLELASQRLTEPGAHSLAIAAIAYACGFTDASHFGRRFKDKTGLTPRDFRNRFPRRSGEADCSSMK